MNILISGGAGYIGSHTAFALKKAGFTPVVLDSLVTGHEWAVKYGPFIKADMADAEAIESACKKYKPIAVMHFAAFIEVAESVENPAKYMENNFSKAKIFFDVLAKNNINKIVFSSTAAVYGAPQSSSPISENHQTKPINPYGESKLAAENYLRSLSSKGIKSFSLRYFNAAGAAPIEEKIGEAHFPETHLIPNAINAGIYGKQTFRIFGNDYPTKDGTAVRDYIHVLDLADAHLKALEYLIKGGETDFCNLGTNKGISVKEILELIENCLGKNIPYKNSPRRAGDPPVLVANSSKANTILGWKPHKSLQETIESAVCWHKGDVYRSLLVQRKML